MTNIYPVNTLHVTCQVLSMQCYIRFITSQKPLMCGSIIMDFYYYFFNREANQQLDTSIFNIFRQFIAIIQVNSKNMIPGYKYACNNEQSVNLQILKYTRKKNHAHTKLFFGNSEKITIVSLFNVLSLFLSQL